MRKKRCRIEPQASINVTPFIDILLVLLVIFMTISPVTPVGHSATIPQQPPPGPHAERQEGVIVVSMDSKGTVRINQDEVPLARLQNRLYDIFKSRMDRTMFVQADTDVLFTEVAHLIDAGKAAGVNRLGLMTDSISMPASR